jgi:hypothetical protein
MNKTIRLRSGEAAVTGFLHGRPFLPAGQILTGLEPQSPSLMPAETVE